MTHKQILNKLNNNNISISKHFFSRMSERNITSTQITNLFKSNFKIIKAQQNKFKLINSQVTILISSDFCLITTYPTK